MTVYKNRPLIMHEKLCKEESLSSTGNVSCKLNKFHLLTDFRIFLGQRSSKKNTDTATFLAIPRTAVVFVYLRQT